MPVTMEVGRYTYNTPGMGSLAVPVERKGCWRRVMQRYRFDDEELETLYQRYIFKLQLSSVVALIALFLLLTATLGVLNLVFVTHITVKNIYYLSQCAISVLLLVYVHTKYMKETHFLPITCILWVLCVSFCVVALPVNFGDRPDVIHTPAEGVWQVTLIVFLVYSLLPLRIYIAMFTGISLPVAHVLIAIFFATSHSWLLWRQVTANLIVFLAVNIAGVYIHDRNEHSQRKTFLDTRNSICARLEMEDENEKLEKLLMSVLPQHVAMEMKEEMLHPRPNQVHDVHIQKYDDVSILSADICGFTELSAQCSSHELVKILNEIVSKFDAIAQDNNCLRIKMLGDNYFCVSGLPDARSDHAQCCVNTGLDMIDVMAALREATDVDLNVRIGIHSGSVVTGVIGVKKWQYDVFSDDVISAFHIEASGIPGRVHISRAVVEKLRGAFQAEPINTRERSTYLAEKGITTFYIVAAHPRKALTLVRHTNSGRSQNLKNMHNPVIRLMAALKFTADPPFSYVYHTLSQDTANRLGKLCDTKTKPNKKRCSLQRNSGDRLNGCLSNAITTRSIKRDKRDHVDLFTLSFKRHSKEHLYRNVSDTSFSTSMLCTVIMLICVVTLQAIVLPRTLLLLVLFLLSFAWVCAILIIVLGTKLKCLRCNIQRNWTVRLLLSSITVLLIHAVAQVNVFCCKGGLIYGAEAEDNTLMSFNASEHLACEMPEYIYLSGVLSIIAMSVFLKLASVAKLCLMIFMVTGYLIVLEYTHPSLFTLLDTNTSPDVPSHVAGIVALLAFLLALYVHGRHQEWTYRLDFLWKSQATQEKIEMMEFQNNNRQVLCNLLPAHVAAHFLELHHRTHMDLYSQAYERVGTLFVSIPNFVHHYAEMANEHKASECLQLLHDILADFDELLNEDRFRGIDKIKTCGSTYMAAVGLSPERLIRNNEESLQTQLSVIVEFYFSMRAKLQNINETAGYSFSLRAGANVGPLVAAVIGARRPQYDLFGMTVNTASTMEKSGKPDHLQVTEEIYKPLQQKYDFQSRGPMNVKYRGQINTYFLINRKTPYSPTSQMIMPSLTGLAWKDGVQLRNPSKRLSIHEVINRRSRPISFHASKENLHQMSNGPIPAESPKVTNISHTNMLATPPGSLNRKRNGVPPNSGSGENVNRLGNLNLMRRPSNSSLQNLLAMQEAQTRVGSPELPVVHFRNINMGNGNGNPNDSPGGGNTVRNLTQSQILHGRCESRCQSRGSISSGKNDTSPLKDSTGPLTTDGFPSSSCYSPTTSPSSLLTTPDSPSRSDRQEDWNNFVGARAIPAPASSHGTPRTGRNVPSSPRLYVNHAIQNDLNIYSEPAGVNNDDLVALNNIMREIYPDKEVPPPVKYDYSNAFPPLPPINKKGTPRGARPKTLGNNSHPNSPQIAMNGVQSHTDPQIHSHLANEPFKRPSEPLAVSHNKPRNDSVSSSISSDPQSPMLSSSSCQFTPPSPYSPDGGPRDSHGIIDYRYSPGNSSVRNPISANRPNLPAMGPQSRRLQAALLQKQHSLPEREAVMSSPKETRPEFGTLPTAFKGPILSQSPKSQQNAKDKASPQPGSVKMEDKGVGTDERKRKRGRSKDVTSPSKHNAPSPSAKTRSTPPPPAPPDDRFKPLPPRKRESGEQLIGPLDATNITPQTALVFVNPASRANFSPRLHSNHSAFKPVKAPSESPVGQETTEHHSGARPKHKKSDQNKHSSSKERCDEDGRGSGAKKTPSDVSNSPHESTLGSLKRPPAGPFQVKRRQKVNPPPRLCRSLDYIPSDIEDCSSIASRPDSPETGKDHGLDAFPPISSLVRALADNISLSSVGSSEMSRSDPALNYDSASTAYESEYDNYRPGMASDEDYFIQEPISDIDLDMFDDINIDNVTVSDTYSLDLPMSLMVPAKQPLLREKKITDV